MVRILNQVEDELADIPYSELAAAHLDINDGRMYPPREDSRRSTKSRDVVRYRAVHHNVYIGANGAIKIQETKSKKRIIIDKSGRDKRKVDEL